MMMMTTMLCSYPVSPLVCCLCTTNYLIFLSHFLTLLIVYACGAIKFT
jgi:hypothetical protein